MNAVEKQTANETSSLRSANLADIELDHLERMVQYVTASDGLQHKSQLDYEYWERRLRALAQTHDLVVSQRRRVLSLLDRLEREALFRSRGRSVA
ncbi:hypothetical protein [Paraburkholderia sp. DHOC27]|uniref:hypothetical protein n=1 Tax=Paraburkholderia sp. DHOC27 TaxID=2303330 RepID=UPI000E3BEE1E|nr:hypothetical protein [Paraburkholderia sp. DHOC27]RFU45022.1 hypothetical protein D0B32_25100 [Paraburkholderia sp. DHOC27]